MTRLILACLLFASLATHNYAATSATSDQTAVLDRSTALDAIVGPESASRLGTFLHSCYSYTGPINDALPRDTAPGTATSRRAADQFVTNGKPTAIIVGSTAVITGRGTFMANNQPNRPGQFTQTWTRETPTHPWFLLAEHRSLGATEAAPAPHSTPAMPATTAGPLLSTTPTTDSPPTSATRYSSTAPTSRDGARTNVFRSYEPSSIGYTIDEGDDAFMDFTFSAMFPFLGLAPDFFPAESRRGSQPDFFTLPTYSGINFYGAATLRAGQYISTRPSAPVVGKRFNPLLAARFWALADSKQLMSSDNFVEFVYAHESNGQFITTKNLFERQAELYGNQAELYGNQVEKNLTSSGKKFPTSVAERSARDNLSRGWDYVGINFSRDWDTSKPKLLPWIKDSVTHVVNAKFNYFLPYGLLQKGDEQYSPWEPGDGRHRKYYDGLSLRYTLSVHAPSCSENLSKLQKLLRFDRRYSLTFTTGYKDPFRFKTLKGEVNLMLFNSVPLTFWARYGYNRDLVDYYVPDSSFGVSLSYWDF